MILMIGLPMMIFCLLVQVATAYWSVRNFVRQSTHSQPGSGIVAECLPLVVAMLVMMAGNIVQIMLWGVLFVVLGEFDALIEAIYHSAVNYASLGYGDIVMSARWRLLGAMEALNGVLMLGMSSAALMAILQQIIRRQRLAGGFED
jgi:Ion channel